MTNLQLFICRSIVLKVKILKKIYNVSLLAKIYYIYEAITFNSYFKIIDIQPYIYYIKYIIQSNFNSFYINLITTSNKYVFYIKGDDSTKVGVYKDTFINLDRAYNLFLYKFRKVLVLYSQGLFQAVKRFIKYINFNLILIILFELLYVDILFYRPVEKRGFNVYLFYVLIYSRGQSKDNFITYKLHY